MGLPCLFEISFPHLPCWVPALSCSCSTSNFGEIFCACCKQLLHAVKSEARKAEQETYSLISEDRLLHEQVALEDSGIKSAPTPVGARLLAECKLQPHLCFRYSSSACGSLDKVTRRPAAAGQYICFLLMQTKNTATLQHSTVPCHSATQCLVEAAIKQTQSGLHSTPL